MTKLVLAFILLVLASSAFAQDKKQIDPVEQKKNEFLESYGFFVVTDSKVSYYQNDFGITDKEDKVLKSLKTVEEIDKFIEIFWKIRDTDPNTPENEFKIEKDQLIQNIKNEIFALQGVNFAANNGLKGDLAKVYLLRGNPSLIERLPQGNTYVEMIAWYYIDQNQRHLFRFIFYDKEKFKVFKDYNVFGSGFGSVNYDYILDPIISPLRRISRHHSATSQELLEVLQELELKDSLGIFRIGLLSFSDYSDVVIEGGDDKGKRFGALDPPKPASIIARNFTPLIFGQPNIPAGKSMLYGSRKSFTPIKRVEIVADRSSGKNSFILHFRPVDLDWEIKKDPGGNAHLDMAEALFGLNLSFQNIKTKEIFKFESNVLVNIPIIVYKAGLEDIGPITLDKVNNFVDQKEGEALSELMGRLEPGSYKVDIDFRHLLTKKPLIWTGTLEVK